MIKNSRLKKLILNLLTLLPMSSTALAAESLLTDIENEEARGCRSPDITVGDEEADFPTAVTLSDSLVLRARSAIFEPLTCRTDLASARRRFFDQNSIVSPEESEAKFLEAIEILKRNKMITINEKEIVSHIPSREL